MISLSEIQFGDYLDAVIPRQEKNEWVATSGIKKLGEQLFCFRGNVPKSICDAIREKFGTGDDGKFIFNLASHVIGGGVFEVMAHTPLLIALGAKKGNSRRHKLVNGAGFLFEVSDWQFGTEGKNRSRVFTLRQEHRKYLKDDQVYATWSDYKQRKPYKERARPFDEAIFREQVEETGTIVPYSRDFIAAMQRLQERPLFFEKKATFDDPLICDEDGPYYAPACALADGRNYTCYKLLNSGRIGTTSKNLQGIPRYLRKYFRPENEENCFLYFDYSSQEPRLLAAFSGDPLLNALIAGNKLYETVQSKLSLRDRAMAKIVFNSIAYNTTGAALAREIFETVYPHEGQIAFAQEAIDVLTWKFPKASEWCEELVRRIVQIGHSRSVGGTVRSYFPFEETRNGEKNLKMTTKEGKIHERQARRAGVNHVLQGTGADILRLLIVELDRHLPAYGAQLVLPLHDAVLVETPKDVKALVRELVGRIMLDIPKQIVPGLFLPYKVKEGWYEEENRVPVWRASNDHPLWSWEYHQKKLNS